MVPVSWSVNGQGWFGKLVHCWVHSILCSYVENPLTAPGGNHEDGLGEAYVNYKERFPMKFAAEASGSSNPLFWSRNLGPMHVISLSSYSQSHPSSAMYQWLETDLAQFDRAKTPWLVAMMHAPWYNSNKGHIGEAKPMKEHMESLFYRYGVNLVLNGHVHSYERTKQVYQNHTDPCGPVYLNLGDGGNREGPYLHWLRGRAGAPRPAWTAFREGSFGVAELELVNGSHAKFRPRATEGQTWGKNIGKIWINIYKYGKSAG